MVVWSTDTEEGYATVMRHDKIVDWGQFHLSSHLISFYPFPALRTLEWGSIPHVEVMSAPIHLRVA